jgi:hypothetical protein
MTHRQKDRRGALGPFLDVLDGTPVPHEELVSAGRKLAEILVARGKSLILSLKGEWAGVWDLERLTDEEAIAWGLRVGMKVKEGGDL